MLSAAQLQLRDAWEGAGKLQKCWCPHTIWWTRTGEAELVRLRSHKGSQVSREKTWPVSLWVLPQTWQKFIVTSMCLQIALCQQIRLCWWNIALLGNDGPVPKSSFFRNFDIKILVFMVPMLFLVSYCSPSKDCAWWVWEALMIRKTNVVHSQPLRNCCDWWARHSYPGSLSVQHSGTAQGAA